MARILQTLSPLQISQGLTPLEELILANQSAPQVPQYPGDLAQLVRANQSAPQVPQYPGDLAQLVRANQSAPQATKYLSPLGQAVSPQTLLGQPLLTIPVSGSPQPGGTPQPSASSSSVPPNSGGSSSSSGDPGKGFLDRSLKRMREYAAKNNISEKFASAQTKIGKRAGTLGTLGGAGLTVLNQLGENQPLGALTGGLTSIVGGMVGARFGGKTALGRGLTSLIGSALGGYIGSEGIENAKAALTGSGKGKTPGGTETPAYIPGTNIPLNETARYLELQKTLGNQQLDLYKSYSAADRAGLKDIIQFNVESQVQLTKRLDPIVQQSKDKDMIRTQSLLNTQGNIEARLGILATGGALAKGAQAEAGALARTFASSNPYAQFATRQSPNIQFG
jgi:hypothetical protein